MNLRLAKGNGFSKDVRDELKKLGITDKPSIVTLETISSAIKILSICNEYPAFVHDPDSGEDILHLAYDL
jgi:hypothetical protein